METWSVTREDGKRVTFTYKETGPDRAKMTAEVEGSIFTDHLEKSGVTPAQPRQCGKNVPECTATSPCSGHFRAGSNIVSSDCDVAPGGAQQHKIRSVPNFLNTS